MRVKILEIIATYYRHKMGKENFCSLAMAKRQLEFYGWTAKDQVVYTLPFTNKVDIAIDYDGRFYHLVPYKRNKRVTH